MSVLKLLVLLVTMSICHVTPVTGDICTSGVCEYSLELRRARTMTYSTASKTYNVRLNGTRLQVAGNSYHKEEYDEFIGSSVNASDVITADGYERDVITINDEFPGPTIEVMEGAQIVVHVSNQFILEGTSIHWHGLDMRSTPFMDGVAYVTQCPILPWQTFTYRFRAEPAGTHWYHSHIATQRLDGLFGLLIIHPRMPSLPEIPFTVMDWLHHDVITLEARNPYSRYRSGTGELLVNNYDRHYSVDNNELTALDFTGALINGRGQMDTRAFPLTEFLLTSGQRYRFRMAHTGAEHTLEVAIDGHAMAVVATDGSDVMPIPVDSVYIMPGETLDFEVTANQDPASYWLRAAIIREGSGFHPTPDGLEIGVKAIVRYQDVGNSGEAPTTSPRECTASQPCRIFNCPYGGFPDSYNKVCVSVGEAKSTMNPETLSATYGLDTDEADVVEYFYNFAFPIGASVNARKFVDPRAPLDQGDRGRYITECDVKACDANGCSCTHINDLPYNKTIQLVVLSYTPGEKFMAHHNVHLHGHNFAVLAMGFPEFNATTGRWVAQNTDIECTSTNEYACTQRAWRDGRRPALNTVDPPIKDTIVIPARGYVVLRFRSDNPGFWLFHCHQELHMMEGMIMLLNEAPGRHPAPPTDFPTCSDYAFSGQQYDRYMAGDFSVLDPDGSRPAPATDSPEVSNSELLDYIKQLEESCQMADDGLITLTTPMAIGLIFAFLLTGAILVLVSLAIYACCSRRNSPNRKM